MSTYLQIVDGRAVRAIEADAEFIGSMDGVWVLSDGAAGIGDRYDGAAFIRESASDVPAHVTMRQARLALLGAGLLSNVNAAIDGLPEPAKSAALIEWEYSSEVWRNRPFVQQLGGALGLSSAQLDTLFIQAATL